MVFTATRTVHAYSGLFGASCCSVSLSLSLSLLACTVRVAVTVTYSPTAVAFIWKAAHPIRDDLLPGVPFSPLSQRDHHRVGVEAAVGL